MFNQTGVYLGQQTEVVVILKQRGRTTTYTLPDPVVSADFSSERVDIGTFRDGGSYGPYISTGATIELKITGHSAEVKEEWTVDRQQIREVISEYLIGQKKVSVQQVAHNGLKWWKDTITELYSGAGSEIQDEALAYADYLYTRGSGAVMYTADLPTDDEWDDPDSYSDYDQDSYGY